jgi:tetratricopeptide (TPR) repeat protein
MHANEDGRSRWAMRPAPWTLGKPAWHASALRDASGGDALDKPPGAAAMMRNAIASGGRMHGTQGRTRRTRWASRFAIAALLASGTHTAAAQVSTHLNTEAAPRPGAEYRKELGALQARLEALDDADIALLDRVVAYCRGQQRPGLRAVSVADVREYEAFLAAHADGQPTEWIDISCAQALQMRGYAAAARQQWPQALDWLDQAVAIGPYLAPAYIERGYVLRGMQRLDEALSSYRQALALSETFPKARPAQAMALRGIGVVLIDLQDLDGARASLKRSLEVEPGNAVALNELEYIDRLQSARE